MRTSLSNFCCRQLQKKQNIFDPPWRFFFFAFFATLPDFVGFTFTSLSTTGKNSEANQNMLVSDSYKVLFTASQSLIV